MIDTSKLTSVIISVLNAKASRGQRDQIKALLDTIVSANVKVQAETKGATSEKQDVVETPNTLETKSEDISLENASFFRLPKEVSVEIEGEGGEPRKIAILPDGISETPNYGNAN